MKKSIAKKWAAALLSGDYEQGRGGLRSRDKFCCLGVLCDLHRKAKGGEWNMSHGRFEYGGSEACLSPAVAKWAGLDAKTSDIYFSDIYLSDGETAIVCNDVYKESFKQIAKRIQKTFLKNNNEKRNCGKMGGGAPVWGI